MHNSLYLKVLAVIIFMLIGVTIGYSDIKSTSNSKGINIQNSSVQPSLMETSKTQKSDISDWDHYKNEKYGFEIRYPPEWFVQETYLASEYDLKEFSQSNLQKPVDVEVVTMSSTDLQPLGPGENPGWVRIIVSKNSDARPLSDQEIIDRIKFFTGNHENSFQRTVVEDRPAWRDLDECNLRQQRLWEGSIFVEEQGELYFIFALVNPKSVIDRKTPIASCRTLEQIISTFHFLPSK